jgi:hypothetical protein
MGTLPSDPSPRRWSQQPLLHFLLIGLALFAVYQWSGSRQHGDKTIVVDRNALRNYIQYRAKYFDSNSSDGFLDELGERELQQLIDEYIREEVLYREALALGLDANDFIIRQRLIQKLEFINKDLSAELTEISDEEMRDYFDSHRDDYVEPPLVTFTHVFFDFRHGGREVALDRARRKQVELNARGVPFTEGAREGDSFVFHTNYVERTIGEVSNHLGSLMADRVFALEPRDELWQGPLASPYGYHLVMVTKRLQRRHLDLDDIYERVKDDARRAHIKKMNDAIIQEIIDAYQIEVTFEPAPSESTGATTGGTR